MQLRLKELREELCLSVGQMAKLKDIWEVRFGQKEPNNSTKRLSRV